MGNLIRCKNGHMFSKRRYGNICPYCNMDMTERKELEESFDDNELEESLIRIKSKPVCAWLVCIKGPRYGKDYRIVFGKNYIGRTDAMDIQIIGDNAIKQENHAILSFDEKDLEATLICTEGGGITYLNGKAVYTPQILETYDVITMGESEFLYIALCGKQFSW